MADAKTEVKNEGGATQAEHDAKPSSGPGPKDNKPPKKTAEKVEPKRAEKVEVDPNAPNPDGDVENLDKFKEPAGTIHTDQYHTQFPGEKTQR